MSWIDKYRARTQLGQILVKKRLISSAQLDKAIDLQKSSGKRLGDILTEWNILSEAQIEGALRAQRNLRMAVAFATALMAPLQAFAVAPAPVTQTVQRSSVDSKFSHLNAMSDTDLDGVSAQGLDGALLEVIAKSAKENGGTAVLGQLGKLVFPLMDALDADTTMKDVVYDPAKARAVINADGSITLSLPSSIGELAFNNIRPKGSTGASFGSITLTNLDFNNSTITLSSRH